MAEKTNRDKLTGTEHSPETATSHTSERDVADRERIARRAYERFQERGGEHGRDQEDWFEAEREARERTSE